MSFGECTVRVKLELTDFSSFVILAFNFHEVMIDIVAFQTSPMKRCKKQLKRYQTKVFMTFN